MNYSIISTKIQIGDQHGTIAVIGPKRMDYGRVTPLVEYVAKAMSSSPFNSILKIKRERC